MIKKRLSSVFAMCLAVVLVSLGALVPQAHAGECKVKDPTEAAIADAVKMGVALELQLEELAVEYKEKTGKDLKVALVARAGQDMANVLTLRDLDDNGRLISLRDIVNYANYEVGTHGGGTPDVMKLRSAIGKKYGDKSRPVIYSHIGLVFRNHPGGKGVDGKPDQWFFRHMLRPCSTKEEIQAGRNPHIPELYDEGIFRFFADDPYELRAQILIPTAEIQDNLERMALPHTVVIGGKEYWDDRFPMIFKGDHYNAAGFWLNQKEANSNQWPLELLAAASLPAGRVMSRADAQNVLKQTGFRPTRTLLSGTQAMATAPFASTIAPYVRVNHDEQPAYQNYAVADLVTTLAVEEYMRRNDWLVLESSFFIEEKTVTDENRKPAPWKPADR